MVRPSRNASLWRQWLLSPHINPNMILQVSEIRPKVVLSHPWDEKFNPMNTQSVDRDWRGEITWTWTWIGDKKQRLGQNTTGESLEKCHHCNCCLPYLYFKAKFYLSCIRAIPSQVRKTLAYLWFSDFLKLIYRVEWKINTGLIYVAYAMPTTRTLP